MQKKHVRANEASFMNKNIKKEIMNRTRLKNKFLKNRSVENNINYKRQRDYCVSLIRKEKKRFYRNRDTKHITDIHTFWCKTIIYG